MSTYLYNPSTSASAERSFSAHKRIETFLSSTQGQDRLSALDTIAIEKELLTFNQNFMTMLSRSFAPGKDEWNLHLNSFINTLYTFF